MAKQSYDKIMSGGLWKYDGDNDKIVLSGNAQRADEVEKLGYDKAERYSVTVFKNESDNQSAPQYNVVISKKVETDDGLPF